MPITTIGNGYTIIDARDFVPMGGRYAPREIGRIQRISVHHSVTDEPQTVEDELATLQTIGNFHIQARQWPGYAYHFTIAPSGRTYYTGDMRTIRYVVGDDNPQNVAICLLGTFMDHTPTDAAIEATRLLIGEIQFERGQAIAWMGHRETPGTEPTACPGATWDQWKGRLGEPAEAPAVRAWSRDEIVASIVAAADERAVPRRLLLGAAIAESGLNQYAAREGEWPDVSYGIGQQTVRYAPVGDGSDTSENREIVKQFYFDPANAIPLMADKLTASFNDPNNPGTDEAGRIMAALSRYNSGNWVIPDAYAANRANYERALAAADDILGGGNG